MVVVVVVAAAAAAAAVVAVVVVRTSSSLSYPWFRIVVNLIAVMSTQQLVSEHVTYSIVRVYSPRRSDARYGL